MPLGLRLVTGLVGLWWLRAILQPIFRPTAAKGTNAAFTCLFMLGAGLHALAFGGN